jgi:hypothetical protein
MTEKPVSRPTMATDNHIPSVQRNFVPSTGSGVQTNHTPTTSESKPNTPPPSPNKK